MKYFVNKSGYTLIEMIIVMAIMAILSSAFMVTYPASQQRTRDTQRRSDIKQYQTALEAYANTHNGFYPIRTSVIKVSVLCTSGNELAGFKGCPDDSKDGQNVCKGNLCRYQYVTDSSGAGYGLWDYLERPSYSTIPIFVTCSNGYTFEGSIQPTSTTTCPAVASTCAGIGGTCLGSCSSSTKSVGQINCSSSENCCISP